MVRIRHFGLSQRLIANCDGSSVIETALVLPTLLLLFAGLIDFGTGFSEQLKTQQAAVRTVELAMVSGADAVSIDTLKAEAAAAANVPVAQVTADAWLECNGTRMSDISAACTTGQQSAVWASVQINNSYRPLLGALLPARLLTNGQIPLVGAAKVRQQ